MTSRPLLVAAAFALGAALTAPAASMAASAPAAKTPPTKAVDLNSFYKGKWIEIARLPMKLTDGCVAGATEYTIDTPTKIAVVDTCHDKTPTGKLKSLGGPGTILDPGTNAKLRVSYRLGGFLPVATWEYWVLDHDDQYTWFISSDPTFTKLWIYARDPRIDPAILKTLVEKAKGLGYDTDKLEFPAQP